MKLAFAFLCESAQTSPGIINTFGVGLNTFAAPTIPTMHPIFCLVAQFNGTVTDYGTREATVRLLDATGMDVISPIKRTFNLPQPLAGRTQSTYNIVVTFLNVHFPNFGQYFVSIAVNGEEMAQLPLYMARIANYHSCFIAYGEPDRGFAEKLYEDLVARGITCWLYSIDAIPGERTQREIGSKRRQAGKFIVLCSSEGLVRDGLLKEIEEQIDEDPNKMVPISLDELWKHPGFRIVRGSRDLKPFLLDKNYADFGESADYGESFLHLLQGLEQHAEPPLPV